MKKSKIKEIKRVLKKHIQESPVEQLYLELVDAGMKRDKKFEKKLDIDQDNSYLINNKQLTDK